MRILLSLLKLLKASIMNNTIIMNQDIHTPAFIKADASNKTDKNRITYPFNDFTALVVATR